MFMCSSPNVVPRWLQVMLTEKFYNACLIHQEEKKNEKNVYCLDCCTSLCPHCVSPHASHRLLQIRRYVYHDIIRMDDAAKLIDCSSIQFYRTNGAKVIFINQRPIPKKCSSSNICRTCARSLQDPYKFCSLSCKVSHLVKTFGSLSGYLLECNTMPPLSDSGLDDGLMTPDSVLEPFGSNRTSSGSGGGYVGIDCKTALACTATTEVVRKKRTGVITFRPPCRPAFSPVSEISGSLMNRRKGTPHRAPLY